MYFEASLSDSSPHVWFSRSISDYQDTLNSPVELDTYSSPSPVHAESFYMTDGKLLTTRLSH